MRNSPCKNDGDVKLYIILRQTIDAMLKNREEELRKYGITSVQAGALVGIHAFGNEATASKLSRLLFREPNSISVLLARMEKQGLIKKNVGDLKKKNLIRISMTDKGYKLYRHAVKYDSIRDVLCALTPKKQQQLYSLLETLRAQALINLKVDIGLYSNLLQQVVETEFKK